MNKCNKIVVLSFLMFALFLLSFSNLENDNINANIRNKIEDNQLNVIGKDPKKSGSWSFNYLHIDDSGTSGNYTWETLKNLNIERVSKIN